MADISKIKALVVDDDLNIRKIIKSVLQAMTIRDVSEATNGQEAFDLLKVPRSNNNPGASGSGPKKYDIVVCDWVMPVMSGIELLEKVRNDTFLKDTPFLMVTAENDRDNIVRAIGEGVNDYVVKPFTASTLEQKIRKVIGRIG